MTKAKTPSCTDYFSSMVAVAAIFIIGSACGRFMPAGPGASEQNTGDLNTNASNGTSAPKFDSEKYAELLEKKKDLVKLSPPIKLDRDAAIKGKVIIVDENLEKIGDYDKLDDGFADYRKARSIEELGTVIQVLCVKGRPTAVYEGKYNKRVKGFASNCKVSIIDYSQPAVVAQKSFSNSKPPEVISAIEADANDEYLMPRPLGDIVAYINEFPVDKEIPTDSVLSEKELLRIPLKMGLDPNRPIKGKVMIATRTVYGEISPFNYQLSTFSANYPDYGFKSDQTTTRSSDLTTLIKIVCGKGERIGKIENTTEFSNKCVVSLVDYRSSTVFAQKTFENKTLNPEVRKEDYPLDWVIKMPEQDITDYLSSFPRS